jgi:hypothetical protein
MIGQRELKNQADGACRDGRIKYIIHGWVFFILGVWLFMHNQPLMRPVTETA